MAAGTLNCPTCGASITKSETACRYCGSRLATVACPACFGTMFVASRFCPHCGAAAAAERAAAPQPATLRCVNCRAAMRSVALGATVLRECERCLAVWLDTESFRRICAEHERQADVLGAPPAEATAAPPPPRPAKTRYRACPVCARLMNRYNFANASGVVIDSCKEHGVWFERDELRRIVEFIRAGGTELAAQREREHDLAKQRWLESQRRPGVDDDGWSSRSGATHGGLIVPTSL